MIVQIREDKCNASLIIFTFVLHDGYCLFYFVQYRVAMLKNSSGCLVDITTVFQKLHEDISQITVVRLIILTQNFVAWGGSHFVDTGFFQLLQKIQGKDVGKIVKGRCSMICPG